MLLSIYKMLPAEQDPVIYAIPVFVILILIEGYITYKTSREAYFDKENFASIGMGLGSVVIDVLMKGLAFGVYTLIYENYHIFEIGWYWWSWVLVLLSDDFTFYWHHRLSHEIRVLWASHVNHHSSQRYTLATALRQSWGERLYKYAWWLWMPLVGFHPLMIMIMMEISLIYQFLLHTKLVKKLPRPFEFIFNTPSHHRVHHAINIRYLDRNHAGVLIIWDRMFGTFEEEREDEPVIYGITTNIHTYNLWKIAWHEYKAVFNDVQHAPTFTDKLKYLFMPPGWSHNGKDQRARTLRKEAGL
ncbi:MAG TPA: sterol desaturase family protein [Chitinophagales bacterium]